MESLTNIITEHGKGTGAIYEAPDTSRAQLSEVAFGAAPANWTEGYDIEAVLAKELNNPEFKLYVNDQGQSGSCGGQSDSKLGEAVNALATKTYTRLSAKFTYAQCFYPQGGTTDSAIVAISTNDGWGTEANTTSYQAGAAPTEAFMEQVGDITLTPAREQAIKIQALTPVTVPTDIDSIAQAVQTYGGVRIGIVGCNNGTWLSANPQAPLATDDPSTFWYHFLYVGKFRMENGIKQVCVLNSWGNETGVAPNLGWQWMNEDYFTLMLPNSSFGKAVWSATTYVYNASPATELHYDFKNQLTLGQSGEDIIALQEGLQIAGFFPKGQPCTGYFGSITQTAVEAFQVAHKLTTVNGPGYGHVGPATLAALNSLYNAA